MKYHKRYQPPPQSVLLRFKEKTGEQYTTNRYANSDSKIQHSTMRIFSFPPPSPRCLPNIFLMNDYSSADSPFHFFPCPHIYIYISYPFVALDRLHGNTSANHALNVSSLLFLSFFLIAFLSHHNFWYELDHLEKKRDAYVSCQTTALYVVLFIHL